MTTQQHLIFGTGPLGISVMQALIADGHPVTMVNRSGQADVPAGVGVIAVDAYDPDQTRAACDEADVIYQCAQPPYHLWAEQFPALQASILEGAAAAGATFIVGENLYMYGEVEGPIHEGLPYKAHTRKGRVRAAMSEALIEAHEQGRVRVAMARGSDFFGPGVRQSMMGERTIEPLLQGKPAEVVGSADLPHTYTYINDFGRAMAILGQHDEALGDVWHVPNPPTLTARQMVEIIAEIAGVEPRISTVNGFMMWMAGLFVPPAKETVEMMYEFNKPFVVDSSKFVKAFGDIATPHETALRETVAWYQGQLAAV